MAIIHLVGIDKLCSIMAVDNEDIALATSDLFQCINDSLTGGDRRIYGKEEALVLGETSTNVSAFLSCFSQKPYIYIHVCSVFYPM